MAQKMVTNFRRSLSFPNHPSHINSSRPKKILHVRSTSLPSRSHPTISQLRDEIAEINSWSGLEPGSRSSSWLCDGLRRLKIVHESLDDLLHLPQTRESLRGGGQHADLMEKFLEDFLRLVDVYGRFQTLVLRLKDEYSAAQIAVRRRDDFKISVHSKNLNQIVKEIGRLVSNFVSMGKFSIPAGALFNDETEVIEVINDVIKATVVISAWVFGGLSNSSAFRKPSCIGLGFAKKKVIKSTEDGIKEFQQINLEDLWSLRKKTEEEVKMVTKKMHELEDCIVEIQGCGERTFRSLINTRVSLLNVLTQ